MFNKKGGYHILDFGNATLSDVAVTIAGMYEAIEGNYKKPLLVAGLGDEVAQFGALSISSGNFVITLTDGRKITVTDDDECTIAAGGGEAANTVLYFKPRIEDQGEGSYAVELSNSDRKKISANNAWNGVPFALCMDTSANHYVAYFVGDIGNVATFTEIGYGEYSGVSFEASEYFFSDGSGTITGE